MGVTVTVKFNRFPQASSLARSGIAAAFAESGPVLLADMQQRTPVATGALRDSESVETTAEQLTLRAASEYAIYVHQGTSRMGARPFMAQAIAGGQQSVVDAIVDQITKALG